MKLLHIVTIISLLNTLPFSAKATFIEYYDGNLTILSPEKARYEVRKQWTIHCAEDKEDAYVYLPYGSFSEVRDLELNIYDQNQRLIGNLRKGDFYDQSLSRGFEITNSRVLSYQFESSHYPFTLELSYTYDYDGLLFLPNFLPLQESNAELKTASLTATCPIDYHLRYKSNKVSLFRTDTTKKEIIYSWIFASQKNTERVEEYSPYDESDMPYVVLAPSDFEIYNTMGSQNSWQEFGDWIVSINEGRQELPKNTVAYLQSTYDSISSVRKKTESIYKWVQDRSRYVSIQQGLGSWQPFSAEEVDNNGYGDCKALVNYTLSALKAIGIESFYTLIRAEPNYQIDTSFCQQSFNHVVLSVPMPEGDTIWLECTSQHTPPNYLSASCSGKYALLVKKEASQIVKTPNFPQDKAIASSNSSIKLLNDGRAQISFVTNYSYYLYDEHQFLAFESKKQQKKNLEKILTISASVINDVSITSSKYPKPQIHLSSELIALGLYNKFGESLALSPTFIKSELPDFPFDSQRKSDVKINYTFIQIDTVHIEIPHGFIIESIPDPLTYSSRLGSFSIRYIPTENGISCILNQKLLKGHYPASSYESLSVFKQNINQAFNRKIVIKVSKT